jgi:hypothetical protein
MWRVQDHHAQHSLPSSYSFMFAVAPMVIANEKYHDSFSMSKGKISAFNGSHARGLVVE